MKKILATIGFMAMTGMAFSQNAYDAMTMSQTNPVLGTARYSGMAGAFTALGGNSSAVKDNPAALGVYRSFDLSFSPSLYINNDGDVKAALDNFAFIINFGNKDRKHGYVTSSLGINYNRLNNFSRYTRTKGDIDYSLSDEFVPGDGYFEDAADLGILDANNPEYHFGEGDDIFKDCTFMQKGHVGQWDIAYGLNISNMVYLGAGFGFTTLEYKETSLREEIAYIENGYSWYLDNYYEATGHGFNFKVGAIVKPIDMLRVGVSFETPTYYDIEEYAKEDLNGLIDDNFGESFFYDMRTPLKFRAGLGFVLGKRALIGLDYQYENFKKTRLKYDDLNLDNETDIAEEEMCKVNTVKLGAEVQVVDGFCLRAGLAYSSKPIEKYTEKEAASIYNFRGLSFPQETFYVTGGAGYKMEHFYIDLSYVFQNSANVLYTSLPLNPGDYYLEENLKTRNIIATFGWRF